MKTLNCLNKILETLEDNFSNQARPTSKNIALCSLAMVMGESCKTPEIISQICRINGKSFDTNEMRLSRFLQSDEFQVDDKLWRRHFKMIFEILKEKGLKNSSTLVINVDMTSDKNDFLILSASLPFHKRGIPLYYTMRLYPKKKNMLDQKKMEGAFIRELRHLLPQEYHYVIVADRGFGNRRFMDLCKDAGFSYIIRLNEAISVLPENNQKLALKLAHSKDFHDDDEIYVPAWKRRARIITRRTPEAKQAWHIVTDLRDLGALQVTTQYAGRFSIEKIFQNEKKSGFLIEDSKIRKYNRYKRLVFLVYVAQTLLLFIGDYIEDNASDIKKNFHWHIAVLSVFLHSPEDQLESSSMKQSPSLDIS